MKWSKKGIIFNSADLASWAKSGAMIPTPMILNNDTVRVFTTFLDIDGIGRTGFVDLDITNLQKVKNYSKTPIFEIGEPGTFDENGIVTCSVIKNADGDLYFYYAGFELGTKIRYRLFTGLVITDSDLNLKRKYSVPILDRTETELFFRCGPFCLFEENIFKMWYVAGSHWTNIDGKTMPVYEIKYLESIDGVNWPKEGKKCINITSNDEHGFGRPYVIKHTNKYKMFYSIRVNHLGYRLGYAESNDGVIWERKDKQLNLDVSPTGWDSQMICYSAVIELNGKLVMFYNGNDFGGSGFGYAELTDE